jgi:ATP-dependent DNA helicase DinG
MSGPATSPDGPEVPREVESLFDAAGELARSLPGFSVRDGQRAMAQDVARLIRDGGALACEAGTGTGKTLAYLLPLLASGRRAVVSTGTRNLQDQLFFRDLPLARQVLAHQGTVALLKGRGNYLCRQRLNAFLEQGRFGDRRVPGHLARIRAWAARTGSGDVAELESVPEDSPAWRFATSTRDNCLGAACPHFDGCHVFTARRRAAQADLVVVNHHLLLAQLTLSEEGGDLVPPSPVLVVDEAHQLPELATEFFGLALSSGQLQELARDADLARRTEAVDMPDLSTRAEALERASRDLHLTLEAAPRRAAAAELATASGFQHAASALHDALRALDQGLAVAAERGPALAGCRHRAAEFAARLALLRESDDPAQLSWLERRERSFTWRRSPLHTGPVLGPALLARHECMLFTSATLAVAGRLSHFSEQVGIEICEERLYPSPFDFSRQALLYLPPEMPEPRASGFAQRVHDCARQVLAASAGRAFVLFTSHAALSAASRELAPSLPFPVLVQGQAPRGQLLESFRAHGNAVLLGTYSFWEGVDVRGEALSCVVIDKLPFAPPDDPLLKARLAALREQGRDPFNEQQLPHAALALKQGVGRLIRDAADRGVVVICDPRLHQRGYGRRLLASLPPMARTRELGRVQAFFRASGTGDYTGAACPQDTPRSDPPPGTS